jgi:hypothetical protein
VTRQDAELEYPFSREWIATEHFAQTGKIKMLELRLVYQGVLPASDGEKTNSDIKQAIRRYFHKQLVNAWKTKYPLRERSGIPSPYSKRIHGRVVWAGGETDRDECIQSLGSKRYLPIVTDDLALVCKLDILLLSRDLIGVLRTGDLDNRIKTLLDALRIPKVGENSDGDEDPLYCLMQDDKLVSELRVTADLLLAEPEQVIESPRLNKFGEASTSPNHVLAVINVAVRPTRAMQGNMDFV